MKTNNTTTRSKQVTIRGAFPQRNPKGNFQIQRLRQGGQWRDVLTLSYDRIEDAQACLARLRHSKHKLRILPSLPAEVRA